MGRRIASESKQTVRGGPKPAKVGLHRRLTVLRQRLYSVNPRPGFTPFLFSDNVWFHLFATVLNGRIFKCRYICIQSKRADLHTRHKRQY